MTMFQWLAGSFMIALASVEVYLQLTGRTRKIISLLRFAVWCIAAALIFFPQATLPVARFLSIGRGTDVLLYCSVIAFLLAFFYVIHALEKQREQLTFLVRKMATSSPYHRPTASTRTAGDDALLSDATGD